ncbi:MAG: FadR family transcriptional regulator [Peptostreptococcaceae bacterium]|nr:FadR family transcriptional regulator [Peptostreptococcaceae bacterium]
MKDMLSPVSQKSLTDIVAEKIESLIITTKMAPNTKLPNEFDLAKQLQVGRSTVREAIKQLESKNVVKIIRGSGTFVSHSMGLVDDPLGFRFVKDKKKLAVDLCEIRSMIEPNLARAAALNATAKDVDELQALCNKVKELLELHDDSHAKADQIFHTKIATCSGNQVIGKLIPIITSGINSYYAITNSEYARQTAPITHQGIVDAIRERNPDKAERIMKKHLSQNLEILLDTYKPGIKEI